MTLEQIILAILSVAVTVVAGFFVWVLKKFLSRIEGKVDKNSVAIEMVEKRQALWILAFTDTHPDVAEKWERRRKLLEGNPRVINELTLEHLEKVVEGRF